MTASVVHIPGHESTEPAPSPGGGPRPSRRRVLVTGLVLAGAAGLTAACGEAAGSGGPSSAVPASGTTVATSDVPVGGGVVLQDRQVVVTQPSSGTYKAFSAVCTHQGCLATQVANGAIVCPCHMGLFSIADGSVLGGPPPSPLPEVAISVSGSTITFV